ncbi:glutamate formimidoyltransferase [Romboutsia lituseburensis]|uniref:glutamate formimidoyltransferase n=1 Tax=Romboutsia lituseburensis TaxID=1537 RepID=UPI0022EA3B44|nr:glutamate formimidoyltransferase [Romboutsia lituseburensis]
MEKKQYVLAVPNFSNGRDHDVIEAVVNEVRKVSGVKLVSYEPEHDFNRTVVTFIGQPQPVKEALVNMAAKACELIDMREHKGTHPRIGAQDTLPIFPFKDITIEECVDLAKEIGNELHNKTKIPIYFAGEAARNEERKAFAYIRAGQYEGVRDLLKECKDNEERKQEYENRKPDLSVDGLISDTAGATICSAETDGLTAYNIFLGTENIQIAKEIAKGLRGPTGGFSTVRAVGIKFPEREGVVVSMNLLDCSKTPMHRAFEFVKREAERYGVMVTGTELVGPIKLDYILDSFEYFFRLEGFRKEQVLETHLMDM